VVNALRDSQQGRSAGAFSKATTSQLYSAALEKADAAKAKKGANAKSK
jgi:hypothetical protein